MRDEKGHTTNCSEGEWTPWTMGCLSKSIWKGFIIAWVYVTWFWIRFKEVQLALDCMFLGGGDGPMIGYLTKSYAEGGGINWGLSFNW